MKRLGLAWLAVVAAAVLAAGCATAQAKADPFAGPALAPPPPPVRTVTPVELPPEPAEPPSDPDPGPTPVVIKPSSRPASPRPDRGASKSAEKADDAPAGAAQAGVPGAALQPLQTTANVAELERDARVRMTQASRDLDRTDYRQLSGDRRTQYDTAKRFIQQASDALRVKNVVFAVQLADKAATLAAALAGK